MKGGAARQGRSGVCIGLACVLLVAALPAAADARFESVSLRVEHIVTDQDYEIVIEATGGDTGVAALKVTAPDGRILLDLTEPGPNRLGLLTFRLETPEPRNLAALQADFPAGPYTFAGTTVTGLGFSATAELSHKLPAAATIILPRPDQKAVPLDGLRLQWSLPQEPASVSVTIEDDGSGVKVVQAMLPGSASRFTVPGLLRAATRYKVGIGAVARSGNGSYVEAAFTTASR